MKRGMYARYPTLLKSQADSLAGRFKVDHPNKTFYASKTVLSTGSFVKAVT